MAQKFMDSLKRLQEEVERSKHGRLCLNRLASLMKYDFIHSRILNYTFIFGILPGYWKEHIEVRLAILHFRPISSGNLNPTPRIHASHPGLSLGYSWDMNTLRYPRVIPGISFYILGFERYLKI